jgi:hypothetical protein
MSNRRLFVPCLQESLAEALVELGMLGLVDAGHTCLMLQKNAEASETPVDWLAERGLEMGRFREDELDFVSFCFLG